MSGIPGSGEGDPLANPEFASAMTRGDIPIAKPKSVDDQPVYQMVGDSALPVSKHMGNLWKSRRDAIVARRESTDTTKAWNESIKYFKNDQQTHRTEGDPDRAQNPQDDISEQYTETENVVYANTAAIVPTLYSKNPVVELTTEVEELEPLVKRIEKLINTLFALRYEPGINLKQKAKRGITLATLTNNAWMETGWIAKQDSSEAAFAQLKELSDKLAKAKSTQEIKEIEGQLMAMEQKIDYLRPSGPYSRLRKPQDVMLDLAAEDDPFNANYMLDLDYVPTELLKALYSKESDTGERVSIFKPTHVMKLKGSKDQGVDEEVAQFSLIQQNDSDAQYTNYGFDNSEAFKKAQMTRVCRVWDKVTRRIYLFNNEDWSWPLWVWDDPYQYPDFFPFDRLAFMSDPYGDETKGEVVYYLDQQDAINEINSEKHLARSWARKNWIFDKNRVSADDVDAIMRGGKQGAVGVDVPEGGKMEDFIKTILPPSMNFMQLFDKQPIFDAIDRVSSVRGVMRGAEFKTNTTNQAIERYDAVSETRMDEKVDAVEDWLGAIGERIAFLCLRFMSAEQVDELLGPDPEVEWRNLQPKEIKMISVRVVGGSTRKPSSAAKKQEALQVGQILGQFARSTPMALVVALKTFQEAFDGLVITDEDWKAIIDSIQQQMQAQQQQQGGGQIAQMIDQLPPPAREALARAIAKGAPVMQALQVIMQHLQGSKAPEEPGAEPGAEPAPGQQPQPQQPNPQGAMQ